MGYKGIATVPHRRRADRALILRCAPRTVGHHHWRQPPACAAAAIAVLEVMEREKLVENAAAVGEYLLGELQAGRRAERGSAAAA